MKTYIVSYTYEGDGRAMIKAESEKEARSKFYNNDGEFNDDSGDRSYVLESVEEKVD